MSERNARIDDPVIRSYLSDVREWHGHIRLLGLPTLKDTPDIAIERLFVPPALADKYVSPDSDASNAFTGKSVADRLEEARRLVVLGDPGGGKSTLINWLAWRLASGLTQSLSPNLDGCLPVPLVLRELQLGTVRTFDDVLRAFLDRPVARALKKTRSKLQDAFRKGKVVFLLDGWDEVPRETREVLRTAVLHGMWQQPAAFWLVTSRLVGYDDCPLDGASSRVDYAYFKVGAFDTVRIDLEEFDKKLRKFAKSGDRTQTEMFPANTLSQDGTLPVFTAWGDLDTQIESSYVLPFDDDRVRAFSTAWYALRSTSERASEDSGNFLRALRADKASWRLARNPQLLAMMALVFKVRVQLPEGRALLYEDIAQAYLESIDASRGLGNDKYPWREKKRWLSRVAFEMQRKLGAKKNVAQSDGEEKNEQLFTEEDVLTWIRTAMRSSGYAADDAFARDYLSHIARRSGLLLPRGENEYAFLHLTFQEYFTACFLKEQIYSPQFVRTKQSTDGLVTKKSLREWAGLSSWREVMVFLFELTGQEPAWAEILEESVFGSARTNPPSASRKAKRPRRSSSAYERLLLRARLAVNPHTGLNEAAREMALAAAWSELASRADELILVSSPLAPSSDSELRRTVLGSDVGRQFAKKRWELVDCKSLNLSGIGQSVVELIKDLPSSPTRLHLANNALEDLSFVPSTVPNVRSLNLSLNPFRQLNPLLRLQELTQLELSSCFVEAHVLSQLERLRALGLDECSLEDISELKNLRELTYLSVDGTPIHSLEVTKHLSKLEVLSFRRTRVSDLEPLADLTELRYLNCAKSSVRDLRPLSAKALDFLDIAETPVSDLESIAACTELSFLDISHTPIQDLRPLSRLKNLTYLMLRGTRVTDLSALFENKKLKVLTFPDGIPEGQMQFMKERTRTASEAGTARENGNS